MARKTSGANWLYTNRGANLGLENFLVPSTKGS